MYFYCICGPCVELAISTSELGCCILLAQRYAVRGQWCLIATIIGLVRRIKQTKTAAAGMLVEESEHPTAGADKETVHTAVFFCVETCDRTFQMSLDDESS